MLKKIFLIFLIIFSLFLENSIISFPLVVLFSMFYIIFFQDILGLLIVFLSGLILDYLLLNAVAFTPLFIFIFAFLIYILNKIFSIQSIAVFFVAAFFGVILYVFLLSYPFSILNLSVVFILFLLVFYLNKKLKNKESNLI